MGGNSRQEYLAAILERYDQSTREKKGLILQEFCAVCGYHRKHAIRLLNRRRKRPRGRPGRRPVYHSPELLTVLKRIWLATDQMCSKKLVAAIPLWLPFYERTYEKLSNETKNKLLSISAATVDRRLAPTRAKTRPRGLGVTKPGRLLRHQISILVRYFSNRKPKVKFTRSRPYKKNDNAHVEQKNWSYVRQLLGYDRLDNHKLVELINNLYTNQWSLYQNHFCPTLKLLEKKRINSKYYKKYETPQTPHQRIMESKQVSKENKPALRIRHQSLDPFHLKHQIDRQLKVIFKLISVTSKVRKRI